MAVNGELLAQAIQQSLTASGSTRLEKYLYPFLYLDTRGVRVAGAGASGGWPCGAGTARGGGVLHCRW